MPCQTSSFLSPGRTAAFNGTLRKFVIIIDNVTIESKDLTRCFAGVVEISCNDLAVK